MVEVHGHRGARGLRPENTLPGFAHALELGVDAIELDVGMSADGTVVLNHDQTLSPVNLTDTAPAWPGDPAFPYVGKRIRDLTAAQLRTLDAGSRRHEAFTQIPVPGAAIPTLAETCALLAPTGVTLAVELKTDPGWPVEAVERLTAAVTAVLTSAGVTGRSRILAFDWRVLTEAARSHPEFPRVALVERKTLAPTTRWLAGLPADDPVSAAAKIGADFLSPEHVLTTPELVDQAHSHNLKVAAWTVNTPEEATRLIDYGTDALVTDYPDRLQHLRKPA
ncbi:glycerophosphodiester phosphodiesterase family protein [Actinomadura livida]|uniref:Glycerophosphodiester phosphodiesterase family protein n=1 Tax=Actinomadura livida TaxID=79909 RepID=A0A7W7MUX5_9ACTN|nr:MULTISPECIES: glycerophosphodiester phosphodiesterase family protein [Actinomadura]MBB4771983.1 glycerophosphoryl diester phosphodiesterase [Actinomadura catellatispora]GGU03844.1 putative glycerophosphoryl diester phosphodiesterase precursor (GlpQ) [Actinomadura livida]